jgi:hypothetical protein
MLWGFILAGVAVAMIIWLLKSFGKIGVESGR